LSDSLPFSLFDVYDKDGFLLDIIAVSVTKFKEKIFFFPLIMSRRASLNWLDCIHWALLFLLAAFFSLSLITCRQVVPAPSVVVIPLPSESSPDQVLPSDEVLAKKARTVLDLPPPVPIAPPMKDEVKIPPPEAWKIVVSKTQHKLFLYQQGELLKMYPVDLGKNPKGPKVHQGDMKTPEGEYRVVEKRDRGQTQFYLAFLLNYPNEADRQRYETAVKSGWVRNDVGIGSLIEIHGEGMGWDWTKGCIALKNSHMQELFNQIPVGTPVWIEP
jgi:lipoprotein-anchoring transpeptidase ErfK/SrfK